MKLLLDENLPKKLKADFPEHEIYTVSNKGWNSKQNGELLKLMIAENFDALFTFDQNLQFQQNFTKYPIAVVILIAQDNTYLTLKELVPQIREALEAGLPKGPSVILAKG